MDEESARLDRLIRSLDQSDKKAVRAAADALLSMSSAAPEIAGRLRAALAQAPAEKRWPIAYVLAHIPPLDGQCLDALKDALDFHDPDIRWAIALLLVRLAKKSEPGVESNLLKLLHTGRPTQRRMAVYCLRDVGAEDLLREALPYSLGDSDPLVRVAAVTSLKTFPEIGRDLAEQVLRLVAEDSDSRVRASAALALAHLGAPTEKILATLEGAIRGADLNLAKAARAALAILEKS
jgi:HEAT repeat protein